jgi:hypothetical protein
VIVRDLDVVGVAVLPAEADPPLAIDADAELPRTIAGESFEPIARKATQILEAARPAKDLQSLLGLVSKAMKPPNPLALIERAGIPVAKAPNHAEA